jgi:hypothetical protein
MLILSGSGMRTKPEWMWMVEGLAAKQAQNYVSVDLPQTFREVFRENMSADPLVADLHLLTTTSLSGI